MTEVNNQQVDPPKQKYRAQLRWRDFTSSIRELQTLNPPIYKPKTQPIEIFLHGCDSIALDKEIEDQVLGVDVIFENLRSFILRKSKYLERTRKIFYFLYSI